MEPRAWGQNGIPTLWKCPVPAGGGSEKRFDGQPPSIDSSGSNDKGADPGSGSDTDSTDGGTSNGNSGQSEAPEDKQVVPLLFRNVRFSVLFLSSGT